MIKHIVMWKLDEVAEGNSRGENAAKIKRELEALVGVIDGLLRLEVGVCVNSPKNFDLMLYSEFESLDALKAYDVHSAHQKVRDFIRKVISERTVGDYEI